MHKNSDRAFITLLIIWKCHGKAFLKMAYIDYCEMIWESLWKYIVKWYICIFRYKLVCEMTLEMIQEMLKCISRDWTVLRESICLVCEIYYGVDFWYWMILIVDYEIYYGFGIMDYWRMCVLCSISLWARWRAWGYAYQVRISFWVEPPVL